ncbi:MAG TPA: alkaline phosphatase family protein [Ardenticatenaceae bacterium]|nr:alkaline phosphatase family protein [Ardenticatenaceae bacterium]
MIRVDLEAPLLAPSGMADPLPAGWVRPNYSGRGFANIPATVGALFDARVGSLPPLDPELWQSVAPGVERVVLVLIDALGWRRLVGHLRGESASFAERWLGKGGVIAPLTAVCPSTTAAATTTLATGEAPAAHGLAGYTLHLREAGGLSDLIFFLCGNSPRSEELIECGLDPLTLTTVPSMAETLARSGVATGALLHSAIANSPLTAIHYRGVARIAAHQGASDFWLRLRELVAASHGQRAYIVAYWGLVDELSHVYGPDTALWDAEWRSLQHLIEAEFIGRLSAAQRRGTLLILTADHGQVQNTMSDYILLREHPRLRELFATLPAGEPRHASFFSRPGAHAAALATAQEELGTDFWVAPTDALLETGVFGPEVWDETRLRLGDVTVMSRASRLLWWFPREPRLLGMHGGLLPEEALVPWMAVRLDA